MVNVVIGTNTNRKRINVDPNKTVKSVLEENNIDYAVGNIHLDGLTVAGEGLNKTFAEHGITESCILISVVKAEGGIC